MNLKVYLRSPPDVLTPKLPIEIKDRLPDVSVPEGTTIETLFELLGVGRARPFVMVNHIRQQGDAPLHEGDRVDLVLPIAGG